MSCGSSQRLRGRFPHAGTTVLRSRSTSLLDLLSAEAQAALVDLIDRRIVERLEGVSLQPQKRWMTVSDAAEYLGTSEHAIYKRIERKQIPFHRPEGSRILINRDELDTALDRCT